MHLSLFNLPLPFIRILKQRCSYRRCLFLEHLFLNTLPLLTHLHELILKLQPLGLVVLGTLLPLDLHPEQLALELLYLPFRLEQRLLGLLQLVEQRVRLIDVTGLRFVSRGHQGLVLIHEIHEFDTDGVASQFLLV
jgi:hypothetical protein